jgi:hypothetical protein
VKLRPHQPGLQREPATTVAPPTAPSDFNVGETLFAGLVGLWLALGFIKFGNPAILGERIPAPKDALELVLAPWPSGWGLILVALVFFSSLPFWRWQTTAPRWLAAMPLVWFVWQVLSAMQTADVPITQEALKHFAACVACFYLGLFAFSRVPRLRLFWIGLVGGFLVVLVVGWQQHFGGLEETRRYFYQLPNWRDYPPEFLKKLSSDRIFSTLFYPNTLAGVVILTLPVSLAVLWQAAEDRRIKAASAAVLAVAGLASLYWSGSKAGWLIVLVQGIVAFVQLPVAKKIKLAVAGAALAAGLAGFCLKYSDYFARGATSASARLEYWRAAARVAVEEPFLGSGPGTFMVRFKAVKSPETEMARLAHNDYLQQASDSGWVGFVAFGAFVVGSVCLLYGRSRSDPVAFAVWLGVAGLAAQGLVEFGLYIPAVAWPQFLWLGWLWGRRPSLDSGPASP